MTQLEQISRQFDEMEDPYLRERKKPTWSSEAVRSCG